MERQRCVCLCLWHGDTKKKKSELKPNKQRGLERGVAQAVKGTDSSSRVDGSVPHTNVKNCDYLYPAPEDLMPLFMTSVGTRCAQDAHMNMEGNIHTHKVKQSREDPFPG